MKGGKKRSRVKGGREKIKGRDIHGPTEVTRRNSSYTRVAFNKFKNISTETFCIESNMVMNFLYTL